MWDSEADKYWKEKEKAKRRAVLQQKAAAGVAIILALVALVHFMTASSPSSTRNVKNVTIAPEILNKVQDDCRIKAIDECNNKCRFATHENPRPTVYRGCQSPCVQNANSMCGLGTSDNARLRMNCQASAQNLAFQVCKGYEDKMPAPRMKQVCKVGAHGGGNFACQYARETLATMLAAEKTAGKI